MQGSEQGAMPKVGDWAVMGRNGVVHLAEMVAGLPRGRARCGAVGTAFVLHEPLRQPVCERCTAMVASGRR